MFLGVTLCLTSLPVTPFPGPRERSRAVTLLFNTFRGGPLAALSLLVSLLPQMPPVSLSRRWTAPRVHGRNPHCSPSSSCSWTAQKCARCCAGEMGGKTHHSTGACSLPAYKAGGHRGRDLVPGALGPRGPPAFMFSGDNFFSLTCFLLDYQSRTHT